MNRILGKIVISQSDWKPNVSSCNTNSDSNYIFVDNSTPRQPLNKWNQNESSENNSEHSQNRCNRQTRNLFWLKINIETLKITVNITNLISTADSTMKLISSLKISRLTKSNADIIRFRTFQCRHMLNSVIYVHTRRWSLLFDFLDIFFLSSRKTECMKSLKVVTDCEKFLDISERVFEFWINKYKRIP